MAKTVHYLIENGVSSVINNLKSSISSINSSRNLGKVYLKTSLLGERVGTVSNTAIRASEVSSSRVTVESQVNRILVLNVLRVDFQETSLDGKFTSSGVNSVESTTRGNRLIILSETSGLWVGQLVMSLNGGNSSQKENSKTRLEHVIDIEEGNVVRLQRDL
jgi:hypothetical protein